MYRKAITYLFAILISLPLAAQVNKAKQAKKTIEPAAVEKVQLDRSKRPQPAPAPVIKIGDYQSFELSNGLKVFVVENHKIPRISYSLVLDYSPVLEGENAGYVDFAGQLLRTGTTTKTKDQIDEAIDFIGANLNTSSNGLNASCLSKHNEELLAIVSDMILNASFKQEEMEKIRTQTLSGLEAEKNEPGAIASRVGGKLLFGSNHPYGESITEESVKKITLEQCDNFYKTYFKPNIGYLAIVGDITLAEAKPLIEKYLGSWQKGDVEVVKYPAPKAPAKTTVALVDRANSVQSTLNVTYPVDLKPGAPDAIKARVTNSILGGGTFRLFNNLREKHGWTYGAYSSLSPDRLTGRFNASAEVRNPVTDSAVEQILFEMNRIRTEAVPEEELSMVKNFMMGNFGRSLENPSTVADFAINTARYNLPKDYYANYLTNLAAVSATDVQMMAQKYIRPDNTLILVVGKAEEIAPKLKRFSKSGDIQYYDIQGKWYDPSVKVKPAPAGVTAETVIAGYIQAIGGAKKLKKVKDITIQATSTMQGMTLNLDQYAIVPDKFLLQIGSGAMIFGKQIYNAGAGVAISPMNGENKPMEATELEGFKEQALVFSELYYAQLGYKLNLLGIEEQDGGSSYYKVEITRPSGEKSTDYYDVKTSLKMKSESKENLVELSDYKEVNGILFPFTLAQSMQGQSIKFTVSNLTVNSKLKKDMFELK
ncbi:MAG: insulinase family protein [Bacteroidales bacterium]|nr:insulinase family protein [Bacteroidales bacterium]